MVSLDAPPPRESLQSRLDVESVHADQVQAAPFVAAPTVAVAAPAVAAEPQIALASKPPAEEPAKKQPAAKKQGELSKRIESAIARGVRVARERSKGRVHGNNCTVAVHVLELDGRVERLSRLANASLVPASNLKLITLAAALAELGPEHQFETPFEARGSIAGGRLSGDLVVRAAGDPLYRVDGDGGIDSWAKDVAQQLRAAGIERVSGDLVLDEGDFLEPGPGPAWPSSREHWKEYCALSGGFSANAGCLTAVVKSTRSGTKANVQVRPAGSGLTRRGEVKTVAKRKALTVAVGATPGRYTVRGSIPADVPSYTARFAVPDPVEFFGQTLKSALAKQGLSIAGKVVRERHAEGGKLVATMRSALADTVVPILRDSNNSVADQVFLHLALRSGKRPNRAGGQAAVAGALIKLGVSAEGLVQVDGSGLSKQDRTSPRQLTALVAAAMARGGEAARLFREALPVAGESGKLSNRMRDGAARGRVRAKTGFVNGASGLSGLVETQDGRVLAFSILVNYPHVNGLNTHAFKPMQDEICEALASVPADGGR
ncbi:MAG: D-alanyl-D-alanine carboxypeptidase/D-alanyl-D-alanine-endopeptidase (penicillin-binding protein 4) [Planctomycetota bacterium]|jgi:D-alanyl-D-alanine carboxypeptidase/D-alanyl-D-alanine-endopeptidase (penicillin-binding protein 4)